MWMARDGASACVVMELAMSSVPPDFTSQMLPLWLCTTTLNIYHSYTYNSTWHVRRAIG